MKIFLSLLAIAILSAVVPLEAQTGLPTAVTLPQIAAPTGAAPTSFMMAITLNGKVTAAFVTMDPAGFVLDTTTTPFTLRAVAPAAPAPLPLFIYAETPASAINGTNAAFTLAFAPNPPASLQLFRNGLLLAAGGDYTLTGTAITFAAGAVPQSGDALHASYVH
jgi:hypothetical protein